MKSVLFVLMILLAASVLAPSASAEQEEVPPCDQFDLGHNLNVQCQTEAALDLVWSCYRHFTESIYVYCNI